MNKVALPFRHANWALLLGLAACLSGCLPEDEPIQLPPAGERKYAQVHMGESYSERVYFDLSTGQAQSAPTAAYDLAFQSGPGQPAVWLNGAKFMFAAPLAEGALKQAIAPADSSLTWRPDHPAKGTDSAAIAPLGTDSNRVYLVDRGQGFHSEGQRYYKLQVTAADSGAYRLRFAPAASKDVQTFTLERKPAYSRVYFSFKDGGQLVPMAPPAQEWDLVFTRYTTIFWDEPVGSSFRHYSVTGALHNRWGQGQAYAPDSAFRSRLPFDSLSATSLPDTITWQDDANIPGHGWKTYQFEDGYTIDSSRYYLLKDMRGYIYKLRFLDFYNDKGTKGSPSFEYQRL